MKKTLYQKTRLGKTQKWTIWVKEKGDSGHPEIWIEHGLLEGKKQTTFDIIDKGVNEGKVNQTTSIQQSHLEMERKITKQKELGYVEDIDAVNKNINMEWDKPFPKSLCFYKPKSSIEKDKLIKLEKSKRAIYSIKRDGLMTVVRMSDLGLEIYSRRMDNISGKFPHLIKAFRDLPQKTILLGEVIFDKDGRDYFKTCCSICRSDDDVAVQKQKDLGSVKYYAFDLAFLNGKNLLTTTTFIERRKLLTELIKKCGSEWVVASELIKKSHYEALEEATTERKLEGLVIWDADGIMSEDDAFCLSGKPRRPNMLWKSKKKMETDVIVKWDPDKDIGDYGNGKLKGLFGNGFMYQLHEGKEIFLGKIGGGFSEDQRKFYTDTKLFPRCWRIEFDSPQSSGKLRFPVFAGDRTIDGDKGIEECDLDERILAAMEDDNKDE